MLLVAWLLKRKQKARLLAKPAPNNPLHDHHESSTLPHMVDDNINVLRASAVTFTDARRPTSLSTHGSGSRVALLSALTPIANLRESGSDSSSACVSRSGSIVAGPPIPSCTTTTISASEYQTRTCPLPDTHASTSSTADHGTSPIAPQPEAQSSGQDLGETMLRSHIAVLEKEVARLRDQQVAYDYLEDAPPPLYREVVRSGQS